MSERGAQSQLDASLQSTQELQNRFVSDNLRRIFLLIYRIVGNVADAQDLTQEAFIKALQRQDQLKDIEKAAHWLSRIASNTAIDFLRRNGKVNFCEIDTLTDPLSEPSESPEQAVLRTEHRAYLERGLTVLTERERTALLLRDVEGLGADEVAAHMNCSKATVRSHIANARIKFRRYLDRGAQISREEGVMSHPNQVQLALLAGGDLGFLDRWRVNRHVSSCSACANEVQALRSARGHVREVTAALPENLNWSPLAEEMTANIRVGLAAGEAIARFDRPALRGRSRHLGWNAALVVACATVVFAAAFWINLPRPQMDHLLSALRRVRTDRIGKLVQHPAAGTTDVMLEASSFSLDLSQNGRMLSLTHPPSDAVTVSVSMRGSVGVRYVDADTGQVTTNKVYDAEQ